MEGREISSAGQSPADTLYINTAKHGNSILLEAHFCMWTTRVGGDLRGSEGGEIMIQIISFDFKYTV